MITLQFVPYWQISALTSEKRIKKLLDIVKDEKIALVEGRLEKHEEAALIKTTMQAINGKFKGIEISVVMPETTELGLFGKIQSQIVEMISGPRHGITIIGPATIIKEIKKDPEKIQLMTFESKKIKKKR
jgi:hypothetical protein